MICKPWRDLLRTREFANFHLSKSLPGLFIGLTSYPEDFKIMEFVDEFGLESHDLHFNTITKFDSSLGLPVRNELKGSANGLLLFCGTLSQTDDVLYVCNPISREYIELPSDGIVCCSYYGTSNCGFGVSKTTDQYKIVRILHEIKKGLDPGAHALLSITRSVCFVYVLGTGLWRSIAPPTPFIYESCSTGVSLNGTIHWLVQNVDGSHCISCFDIETELFSTFLPPPLPISKRFQNILLLSLVDLGGYLCVCDNTVEEIDMWLMKEYGDEKSWTKEFVIRKSREYVCYCEGCTEIVYPIRVFKDGDILMAWFGIHMFYYSDKTKTTARIDMFGMEDEDNFDFDMKAMLHTSSFLSLTCFPKESVITF
ncbi:hypothetical protein ABFS83_02G092000 [Erythranthe nasuta]